tara:strand:+ start:46 stop:309 length:264 start_codon:yes stop_codon:yes gene_type:complete
MLTEKKYGEKFFHSELKSQYKYLDRIKRTTADKGKDPNGNDIPPIKNVAQMDKIIQLHETLPKEKFSALLKALRNEVIPYDKERKGL